MPVRSIAATSAPLPHIAILPGRSQWVKTCHADPAGCDDCLRKIAQFLAGEMNFELNIALERTTESYRQELSCSAEQARTLRRLTCQACLPADRTGRWSRGLSGEDLLNFTVADVDGPSRLREVKRPTSMSWRERWSFRLLGVVLWALLIPLGAVYLVVMLIFCVVALLAEGPDGN